MVKQRRQKGKRWRYRISPEQVQLARAVVTGMNDDFAKWGDAHAVFDAGLPKELQCFGSEPAPPTPVSPLDAMRRVFESRALRVPVRLLWPLGIPHAAVWGETTEAGVLVVVWHLIGGGGWRLITRCQACTKWTVNEGPKVEKRFCSTKCRADWWNAPARRAEKAAARAARLTHAPSRRPPARAGH